MKNFYRILIFLAFISTACNDDNIKIGFSGNLTGNASDIGREARNGILIAVDKINNEGGINGKQIKLIIQNDFGNPDSALKIAYQFQEDEVKFVIGHLLSSSFQKIFTELDDLNILYISPLISSTLYADVNDNFLTILPTTKFQSQILAKQTVRNNHLTFYTIINLKNEIYTDELSQSFKNFIEISNGEILKTDYIYGDNNSSFVNIANDIKKINPDAILMAGSGFDCAMLAQNLEKIGLDKKIYTGSWGSSKELIEFGGNTVNGKIIAVNYHDNSSDSIKYLLFESTYKNKYHEQPSFASIFSYDAAAILFTVLASTENHSLENIKRAILTKRYFQGLQTGIEINKFGDSIRESFLYNVRENEFIKIQN